MSIQVGDWVKVVCVNTTEATRDQYKKKMIGVIAQVDSVNASNNYDQPYRLVSCAYGFDKEEIEVATSAGPIAAGDLAYVCNYPNPVKVTKVHMWIDCIDAISGVPLLGHKFPIKLIGAEDFANIEKEIAQKKKDALVKEYDDKCAVFMKTCNEMTTLRDEMAALRQQIEAFGK